MCDILILNTIALYIAVFSTATTTPWPPDVDFSSVFYSEEVYCCRFTTAIDHTSVTMSPIFKKDSVNAPLGASQSRAGLSY